MRVLIYRIFSLDDPPRTDIFLGMKPRTMQISTSVDCYLLIYLKRWDSFTIRPTDSRAVTHLKTPNNPKKRSCLQNILISSYILHILHTWSLIIFFCTRVNVWYVYTIGSCVPICRALTAWPFGIWPSSCDRRHECGNDLPWSRRVAAWASKARTERAPVGSCWIRVQLPSSSDTWGVVKTSFNSQLFASIPVWTMQAFGFSVVFPCFSSDFLHANPGRSGW